MIIKTITLVISSMGSGGAERVMSILANYWAEKGVEVTLITLWPENTDFYELDTKVKRISIGYTGDSVGIWKAITSNYHRIMKLRKEIKNSKPDIIISFMDATNILTLLASTGLRVPVIVAEHTDPKKNIINAFWDRLRVKLYPKAKAVVVLSEGVRNWAQEFIPKELIHIIPNPIELNKSKPISTSLNLLDEGSNILAMGRLGTEKGFDILLRAFARCYEKFPNWNLVILGEGTERGNLESLVKELGISDRVKLPGRIKDPTVVLSKADLFVMSSRFEGFPMALLEAMACGLPVICTNCTSGIKDIIRNEIDGILIPPEDINALTMSMERLMSDKSLRSSLASRSVEVTERFSLDKVMAMWENIIEQILDKRKLL